MFLAVIVGILVWGISCFLFYEKGLQAGLDKHLKELSELHDEANKLKQVILKIQDQETNT